MKTDPKLLEQYLDSLTPLERSVLERCRKKLPDRFALTPDGRIVHESCMNVTYNQDTFEGAPPELYRNPTGIDRWEPQSALVSAHSAPSRSFVQNFARWIIPGTFQTHTGAFLAAPYRLDSLGVGFNALVAAQQGFDYGPFDRNVAPYMNFSVVDGVLSCASTDIGTKLAAGVGFGDVAATFVEIVEDTVECEYSVTATGVSVNEVAIVNVGLYASMVNNDDDVVRPTLMMADDVVKTILAGHGYSGQYVFTFTW